MKILCKWARYSPNYPFVLKIKPISAKSETPSSLTIKALPANLPMLEKEEIEEETTDTEEDKSLNILNSFYIRDMEKTINHIANHGHPLLEVYISGFDEKIDVFASSYHSQLLNQLQPRQTNWGRWPTSGKHVMSLMQQLCINQCFNTSPMHPLTATNGPPGTGKTTLLKDIVADNIVQRAKTLASFSTVKACFSDKKIITIGDNSIIVNPLKPELTGFEMLVVSSNNTAVENITRDLPLKTKLAQEYQESCHYLRPIAAKLAANHFKQTITPLSSKEHPWGLIAVALGKSANRKAFIERFFFSPDGKNTSDGRIQRGEYLTIWEWRDRYKGSSFAQSKISFTQAWTAVEHYRDQLQTYYELHQQLLDNKWAKEIQEQQLIVVSFEKEIADLEKEKRREEHLLKQIKQQDAAIRQDIERQLYFKPTLWRRLFRFKEASLFQQIMDQLYAQNFKLAQESIELQTKITEYTKEQFNKQIKHSEAIEQLKYYQQQQEQLNMRYFALKTRFPNVNIPTQVISEEDQVNSYWQSEEYNHLRAQLFIQALQLHQSWLAEALQKKYFGSNLFAIQKMLEGNHPIASSDELIIWQSLFMVIPVVSSTFSSVARQFKNLESQALGWLLIDEAGQAPPQAAVGAFWRCKKAIVVGDPRQIEPIMTLPPHLIEGVAKHHFSSINPYWLPHTSSIQKLADLATPLGSLMQHHQQQEWIGIPLLVHRRCLNPMFQVANEIAYENKMIHACAAKSPLSALPDSTWFDVSGIAIDKQYVSEQGDYLLNLFIWFYNYDQGLPKLFIITPFKRIKKYLKELIQTKEQWIEKVDPSIPVSSALNPRLNGAGFKAA